MALAQMRASDFGATEKINFMQALTLDWVQGLSDAEFKLVSWLAGNTILRGKRQGCYSIPQLVDGVPKADGSGMWCGGTGLSRRTVFRTLPGLIEKGVLFSHQTPRGTVYAINLNWKPTMVLKLPSKPQRGAKTPSLASRSREGGCQDDTWGGANLAPEECHRDTPSRGYLQEVNLQEEDHAASPVARLAEVRSGGVEEVIRQVTSKPVRKAPPPANASGYERTWRSAWAEHVPEQRIAYAWTKKEAGMLAKALKRWPEQAYGGVHEFLAWTVANWKTVIRVKFSWMTKSPPPDMPSCEFLAKFMGQFLDAYCEAETLKWIGTLPGTQKAIQEKINKGMSEEAARLEVAKEQALSTDREARASDLAAARRMYDMAALAAKRADATRFTKDNPHPRAHENKRTVREIRVTDEKPNFQQLPKVDWDAE